MTPKGFHRKPVLSAYTWRDVADASTPEELHLASFGIIIQELVPTRWHSDYGVGFVRAISPDERPEGLKALVVSGESWYQVRQIAAHSVSLTRSESVWAISGITERVFQRYFVDAPGTKLWIPGVQCLRFQGADRVSEVLELFFHVPPPKAQGQFHAQAINGYGQNAVPGIRLRKGRP